jgi:hypothetical protein
MRNRTLARSLTVASRAALLARAGCNQDGPESLLDPTPRLLLAPAAIGARKCRWPTS